MVKKILIIEDDQVLLKAMGSILLKEGYQVYCAPGGSEGLVAIRQKLYDLIVLDLVLPRVSGFELLSNIKQQEHIKHTPVIVISSLPYSNIISKQPTGTLRNTNFLPKPFKVEELVSQVQQLLN